MAEIWKDIQGYEGLYQVSNLGRIKSLDRIVKNKNGMALKRGKVIQEASLGNYKKVSLWKNNKGKAFLVHRLVAIAFIENPDNLPEVNHKDENGCNNSVDNLEWCTHNYNYNYGTRKKRISDKMRGRPIGEQPVLQYTKEGVFVCRYDSALKAAEAIKGDNSAICRCANGKSKTSYGYKWEWEIKKD